MSLVTFHAGFLPHDQSSAAFVKTVARLETVAEILAAKKITLGLETGQETAADLVALLQTLKSDNVGVNFDPANMVLYGSGEPGDAIRILGRHIRHVHVKDAMLSDQPRMKWGAEVAFGTGQIRPRRFLDALDVGRGDADGRDR